MAWGCSPASAGLSRLQEPWIPVLPTHHHPELHKPSLVMHTHEPSTQEEEAEESAVE